MKKVVFLGDSRQRLRAFPDVARRSAGESLKLVQEGLQPKDWKSMVQVGPGVQEIRVWDETGSYRVVLCCTFRGCRLRSARFSEEDSADHEAGFGSDTEAL